MPFRHYLEDEDDKPYFTQNSLAFYYEDMERKQKLIESLAKNIAGYDIRLTDNLEAIEKEVDRRLADWDKQLERFPDSVEGLLTKWSTDGTIDTVIQTALIDEKIAPVTAQLAETAVEVEDLKHLPKIMLNHVAHRGGIKNQDGAGSDYVVFIDVYHVYDASIRSSGVAYGLEQHKTTSTTQRIYRSFDGGTKWELMGSLPMNAANGVWFEGIFVEPFQETVYVQRTNNGFANPANRDVISYTQWPPSTTFSQIGIKNIGTGRWLSSNQSIDANINRAFSKRIVIFGEYVLDDAPTAKLWRTEDRGATWQEVLSFTANNGTVFSGEIRHFHTVASDPFTKDWWASSGDGNPQCRIWRSTDEGFTWTEMYSGSQRERTCSFVFEKDYIYYGMDATWKDADKTKIVRIKRSDWSREDIATVHNGYAVFSLTRCHNPAGFLVWSCYEPGSSIQSDQVIIQFYDYLTEKLYDVGHVSTKGIPEDYKGFQGASRMQDMLSGKIFIKPTISLTQGKYSSTTVSRYMSATITV